MILGQVNPLILSEDLQTNPPEFPGSANSYQYPDLKSIDQYLRDNFEYPQNEVDGCSPGTEVISFTVTSTGKLTDYRVINSCKREVTMYQNWQIRMYQF